MDLLKKKKIAAAVLAIDAYMQQEAGGALTPEIEPATEPGVNKAPVAIPRRNIVPDFWSSSGRQAQMTNMMLVQMRAFK